MVNFKLNSNEENAYNEFKKKHYKCSEEPHITLHITPIGIGNIFVCECMKCKEKIDITDIQSL